MKKVKREYKPRKITLGERLLMNGDTVFPTLKLLKEFKLDPKHYCQKKKGR